MRNRLLLTYLLVAIVSIGVAYLTSIFFLQRTTVEYLRQNQIEDNQPFQQFFEQYYQSHNGWEGIEQIDVNKVKAERIPCECSHFALALVDTDGMVLFSENKANYETTVAKSTMEFGAPVIVDGEMVAYLFSVNLTDFLLPQIDQEIINRTLVAGNRATLAGLAAGIFTSVMMTLALLRPIKATIQAVKKISQGELSMRVSLEPYRDMAELGQAINDMATDLERNQHIQKYMLMDIAHDFRTPLSVQKATIEAFEDKVYQFDEEGLALLKMQNNQLVRLVKDLRLLTLSDADILHIHKERISLRTFIQANLNSFESTFAKKNIRIFFKPPKEEFFVDIDPHLMQRVFENLLQNAYQHSPEGGEIRVRILRMINRTEIIITDQGPGIPKDKLDTIFNRYYRVKPAGEGIPEGLGLGLTISRRIIEAHGGKLYARNSPGYGAEFVIELPYSA